MNIISIDYIKGHSRIDEIRTGTFEQETLELYGDSAEATVLNILNRSLASITEEYGSVPAPIKHACLMLVDLSYEHRSPISMTNLNVVPYTFEALLKFYMIL